MEKQLIKVLREKGQRLANLNEGGDGGWHHVPETIEKISKSLKGKPVSAEHRKALSEAKKGKIFSKEHCENISKGKKELNKKTLEEKENLFQKITEKV